VRRYGEGIFPVDVRIVFENKEEQRWHWDGKDRWKMFEIEKPVRAAYAEVDPEHVLLLDIHYTNNSDHAGAAGFPRGAEMVARLVDLAAGPSAHLRLLRLMSSPQLRFEEGIRRVNGAPALLAGTFAVTLLVSAAAGVRAAGH